jgi:hypothetical protein
VEAVKNETSELRQHVDTIEQTMEDTSESKRRLENEVVLLGRQLSAKTSERDKLTAGCAKYSDSLRNLESKCQEIATNRQTEQDVTGARPHPRHAVFLAALLRACKHCRLRCFAGTFTGWTCCAAGRQHV